MFDKLLSIVGGVAPTIATALGGPLAGGAVRFITDKLGLESGASEGQIVDALADPKQMLRLKELDHEYRTEMLKAGVDLERIAMEDRNSARQREVKAGGLSNPILAGGVLVTFAGTVISVLSGYVDLTNPVSGAIIGTLIGYVSAKADQVVSYYFGSSSGSKLKTELMGKGK